MSNQFCNYGEFLLFINASQGRYIHECDMNPTLSAREAAYEADENIDQIIRMDRATWNGEDVTEDVSMAWLTDHMHDPSESETFPLYVRNSEALEKYAKEWADTKADFKQMQAQGVA